MNNTCRIAAGHLGSLLAKQRAHWDFRDAPLTPNGRSALWFITDENSNVESINVANNDVGPDDVAGLTKCLATCSSLSLLDLGDNDLQRLTVDDNRWRYVCDAIGANRTLTDLNLNNNRLGPVGVRIAAKAILNCTSIRHLGFSNNEPGVEPALADLLRAHPNLGSIEIIEELDRYLPSRAKDALGRALLDNKHKKLGFLQCDVFKITPETKLLTWSKDASTSDAVLLAGVLVTNTTLTTFNIGPGATLANAARSALGEALLNNPGSRVAFCNDFGLQPSVDTCEFDLSKTELKEVEPFRFLAGCLRGNRTLTAMTLKQLRMEQIPTLGIALRGNDTLAQLDILHTNRIAGQTIIRLSVPELNGSKVVGDARRVDLSRTCIEGAMGRVACSMIGMLIAPNTALETLDLSNTGVGIAIGLEGEGGHILLRPMLESPKCPLREINLTNVQLNDKAGGKLLSCLSVGLGKRMPGYVECDGGPALHACAQHGALIPSLFGCTGTRSSRRSSSRTTTLASRRRRRSRASSGLNARRACCKNSTCARTQGSMGTRRRSRSSETNRSPPSTSARSPRRTRRTSTPSSEPTCCKTSATAASASWRAMRSKCSKV